MSFEYKVGAGFARAVEEEKKIAPTTNTYIAVTGKLGIEASGDKLLILEDEFKSGYECESCEGTGLSALACPDCAGQGGIGDRECRKCRGKGRTACAACDGKTVDKSKGGLIIPENAERRPSTGKVISIGPLVKEFAVGERVIYSNFTGVFVNLKNKQVMRFMREHEPLGKLYGVASVIKDILQ